MQYCLAIFPSEIILNQSVHKCMPLTFQKSRGVLEERRKVSKLPSSRDDIYSCRLISERNPSSPGHVINCMFRLVQERKYLIVISPNIAWQSTYNHCAYRIKYWHKTLTSIPLSLIFLSHLMKHWLLAPLKFCPFHNHLGTPSRHHYIDYT